MPKRDHSSTGAKARVLSFGAIGGIGFVVDAGILQALFALGMLPLIARCISFPVAVTVTWLLNRRYTFRDRSHSGSDARYFLYVGGQIVGAFINVGVFVLTIRHWPGLALGPLIPMIAGSALALIFNFAWANLLVFRQRPPP
ncbi:MAG TPA: GtrA family protein [Steroidobacteraceae bacterium]